MAATFVKCTRLQGVINSNAASGSVSATAGNTLIALSGVYYPGASATPTMTMTGGGTWVTDARNHQHFTANNDNFSMGFASVLSATGGTATFTVTWSNSATNSVAEAYIYEFSGMPASGILDTGSTPVGQQGSASPVTTSSLTNANAADVMLAIGVTYSSGNETHGSPTNSWTMPTNGDETNGNALTSVTAYKIVAASAAQSTSWTDSPSVPWTAFIAAYKSSAATQFSLTRSVTVTTTATVASAPKFTYPIARSATVTTAVALVKGQVLHKTVSATQGTSATVAIRRDVKNTATVTTSVATAVQLGTSSVALPTNYYATVFPLAENPINEGGVWTLGGRDGVDWTNPRTVTNKAFGVQSGTDNPPYTDGIAVIKGTWGNDQEVTTTVFSTVGNGGYYTEVEHLLRFNITSHATTGYEITFNVNPTLSYIQVNRWNGVGYGTLANYTLLTPSTTGVIVNGDVLHSTIIGSTIRVYLNGTNVLTVTDSTYASGRPGIGFFNSDNGNHADPSTFGFTRATLHTVGAPIPLTRSITQGTSVKLARKPFLTRALQQAQAVTVQQQSFLRRLLSVAEAVSLTRGSSASTQTVSAIAQTVVSLQVRQVQTRTLLIVQGLSATLTRQLRLQRTLPQPATPLIQKQARLSRTLLQGNHPSISSGATTAYALVVVTSIPVAATLQLSATPPTPIPPEPGPPPAEPIFEPFAPLLAPALSRASVPGAPPLLPYRRTGGH